MFAERTLRTLICPINDLTTRCFVFGWEKSSLLSRIKTSGESGSLSKLNNTNDSIVWYSSVEILKVSETVLMNSSS